MPLLYTTLLAIEAQIDGAKAPEDVFGDKPETLRSRFRELSLSCHPNVEPAAAKDILEKAAEVYTKLQALKQEADVRVAAGTYGLRLKAKAAYQEKNFSIGGKGYKLVELLGEGVVGSVHRVEGDLPIPSSRYFLKVARRPGDNDLIDREFRNLQKIVAADKSPAKEEFFKVQRMYVPHPWKNISIPGAGGAQRKANFLVMSGMTHYTATELREMPKFRQGIGKAHVFWITRRLLLTAGMAHLRGIVHGAISPDHVYVCPEGHGLCLLGWTQSSEIGKEKIPIADEAMRSYIAPEIYKKALAHPAMDVCGIGRTALFLLGDEKIPAQVRDLFDLMVHADPAKRPQDAMALHDELGQVIDRYDGPRRFVELVV